MILICKQSEANIMAKYGNDFLTKRVWETDNRRPRHKIKEVRRTDIQGLEWISNDFYTIAVLQYWLTLLWCVV
jgi:hypothetical protein